MNRPFLIATVLLTFAVPSFAQDDTADMKTIQLILREIELVPSLYAKGEEPMKFEALPKFATKKLAGFLIKEDQIVEKERERWQAAKFKYAKQFPLRAPVFAVADETANVQKLNVPHVLLAPVDLKKKVAAHKDQEALGRAIFKLEEALAQMKGVADAREKSKNKRWQANYDFALARLQTNLVFLIEYNYVLGRVRADDLPDLRAGDDGWKLTFAPRIAVTEQKAKDFAKDTKKRWAKIQEDYADTPWAYFAQRESERPVGMQWAAKKK